MPRAEVRADETQHAERRGITQRYPYRFAEAAALTPEDLAAVQQPVRAQVLRWFARAGHLDQTDARDMAGWHHGGGFSLDAAVRIEGSDRAGLERLLRYCARPPFALERLEQVGHNQLVYRSPKPQPDGSTQLRLTPLELIDRLAALIQATTPRATSSSAM